MLTATQFAQQIVAQARVLDPSFSGEVGTPERKIIDTVSQALADNQIDLTGLGSALDVNTKVGSTLDSFTALFGMTRQQPTSSTGFVVYSRNTPAPANIAIPQGSVVQASNINANTPTSVQYTTSQAGTIAIGETASAPIPVTAVTQGTVANLAANTLTQMVGTPIAGVTAVTNPSAINSGIDAEDDNSFKTRFVNTWARNLAGTSSQYLAIALAAAFTTKANCIGAQSTFREYIQVPDFDDTGLLSGAYNTEQDTFGISGNWTAALSDIPYAAQIFTDTPVFVSIDSASPSSFFRPGTDFLFNYPPDLSGDALRDSSNAEQQSTTLTASASLDPSTTAIINVTSTVGFPSSGILVNQNPENPGIVTYTSITATQFLGCTVQPIGVIFSNHDEVTLVHQAPASTIFVDSVNNFPPGAGSLSVGLVQDPDITSVSTTQQTILYEDINYANNSFTGCTWQDWTSSKGVWYIAPHTKLYYRPATANVPNITFLNVFNPVTDTDSTGLQVVNPGDVVLSEYSYLSTASRNDLTRNINNAVDVYVNGSNDVQASTVFLPNVQAANSMFLNDPTLPFYYENFRRNGEPTKRPQIGNYFTPLYGSPLDGLPGNGQIQVSGQTFYEGWHYWLVQEIGPLARSVRARDGIEWNTNLIGDTSAGPPSNPLTPYVPTGGQDILNISEQEIPVEVDNYLYDSNIVTMQTAMEAAKQITTDVLVHKSTTRYFKFFLTLQYMPQQSAAVVNSAVQTAIQAYLNNQYFGTVVQLSNIIETAGVVSGVQNIRWTNDVINPTTQVRAVETDINGIPLSGASVDRFRNGIVTNTPVGGVPTGAAEQQTLYIAGSPTGIVDGFADSFTLSWFDATTTNGGSIPGPDPLTTGLTMMTTEPIPFFDVTTGLPLDAPTLQEFLNQMTSDPVFGATGMYSGITATLDSRSSVNVNDPLRSFTLTYAGNGTPVLPSVVNNITASEYTFDGDFFLLDDQLPSLPMNAAPGDTLPGVVIEVRAQNTWLRR